jgi:hypothetical protein
MASDDTEAMRQYQQLMNEDKPRRNPLGLDIETGEDEGSDLSEDSANRTPR